MKRSWIINTVLAVLAAVFSILQEVWLGTTPNFLAFLALGSSYAISFSFATELVKWAFSKWSWSDAIFGSIAGVIVAVLMTFVCAL